MSRTYSPTTCTQDCENDPHHTGHSHTINEPPEIAGIADDLARDNVLYIKGVPYLMDEYSPVNQEGYIYARLRMKHLPPARPETTEQMINRLMEEPAPF